MAYIPYIPEDQASDDLRKLYQRFHNPAAGHPDNILRIHSHNPRSMETHYEYYRTIMRGRSELSRARREMIAVVVSAANRCHY